MSNSIANYATDNEDLEVTAPVTEQNSVEHSLFAPSFPCYGDNDLPVREFCKTAGVVRNFNQYKGFGFILTDTGDLFFHTDGFRTCYIDHDSDYIQVKLPTATAKARAISLIKLGETQLVYAIGKNKQGPVAIIWMLASDYLATERQYLQQDLTWATVTFTLETKETYGNPVTKKFERIYREVNVFTEPTASPATYKRRLARLTNPSGKFSLDVDTPIKDNNGGKIKAEAILSSKPIIAVKTVKRLDAIKTNSYKVLAAMSLNSKFNPV